MRDVIGQVGALVLVILAIELGISESADRWLTDWHWRVAAAHTPAPFDDMVIVAIDDKTLQSRDPATGQRFGRTGDWSRARHAQLLDKLALAKAVGFDVLFLDEGRDPDGDRAFAEAVRRQGRVVMAFNTFVGTRQLGPDEQRNIAALLAHAGKSPLAASLPPIASSDARLQSPLPELMAAARYLGCVDVTADSDGVFRSVTPLWRSEDGQHVLPHFAVALAALATDTSPEQMLAAPNQLTVAKRALPLAEGRLRLQPMARRPDRPGRGVPVRLVSYCDALRAAPGEFSGKIVLVGETASGTTDVRGTALDESLRGVEYNADILANLLRLRPTAPLPMVYVGLLVLLAVGLPLWFFGTKSPRPAALLSLGSTLALLGAMELCFWRWRLLPPWSAVLIGALGATLFIGLLHLVEEERAKRQIRRSFSMYVAPEVVAMIAEDPAIASQQGTRQPMAVLFSDVRGFTSYCEQNPAELVVAQMREYLAEMTVSVDNFQGVLDKFVGDAVMALYGPFLDPETNSPALAVASALDMLARLEALNATWAERGWPQLKIGVGIHYGQAILGNIGSERKMQYTALGDTVNTAARLESMTKEMGVRLLVSQEARALAEPVLGEVVEFRPLGQITVRNRAMPVTVFEASRRES